MQPEAAKKPVFSVKAKPYMGPALFVVVLAFAIFQSNRDVKAPGDLPLIRNADEYQATLDKANKLFLETVPYVDHDEPISADIRQKLVDAAKMFDSLNVFEPMRPGPYFASGHIHLILGENEAAKEKLRQAIDNAEKETNTKTFHDDEELIGQANFYLAKCLENDNDWAGALEAVNASIKQNPQAPEPYYVRARAEIQYNQVDGASADLRQALQLNPNYKQALGLRKFLESTRKAIPKGQPHR